jgi:hypothetical protein
MRSILAILMTAMGVGAYAQPPSTVKGEEYRLVVREFLEELLEHGTDRYGPEHTPMLMSIIDLRTKESPQVPDLYDGFIRSEGRLHRRNPGGADLWDDQALLRTLYALSELSGVPKYREAADAYVEAYFARAKKPNGLLAWGSHIFYDAYTDAPGGDQDGAGPHETLVLCPEWAEMSRAAPDAVRSQIEGMWDWHLVDGSTGLFNRHDDRQRGCDFAFFGGELVFAFAHLYSITDDPDHLAWAERVMDNHWNARNRDTNLAPDATSTGDRYDASHSFTTLSGPHAAQLLKAYDATGHERFRNVALAYIRAYDEYAWDEDAGRYHAMLQLDGTPVAQEPKRPGYDAWKPTGYVDIWRAVMYSYEFPLIAAQTAVYAYEVTRDAAALDSARHWAVNIRQELPPNAGRRWGDELLEALPELKRTGGTYAENYGRAISFFLGLHRATGDDADLETAQELADEAIEKLCTEDGWFRGHPAKPYYESTDGVGYLLYALLELSAHPKRLSPNL